MTLLSQALTDVDAAREKPDLFIATFLLSSNEILQNFSCNFKFFAHATLLKAVSGLQYIITVARSADAWRLSFANANLKFQDPHISDMVHRLLMPGKRSRRFGFYAKEARLSHRNSLCLSVRHTGGSVKNGAS